MVHYSMGNPVPLAASFDRVADRYAAQFQDELDHKPFDRKILDWLIEKVEASGGGRICDMGCGPGQVAHYLHQRGAETCGIDLSPAMVGCAARLFPGIPFQQGDMLSLVGVPDRAFGGIAAFYSVIHIARQDIAAALTELKCVLRPGGVLLLAFHLGCEVVHKDEWWGQEVSVDFIFYQREEILAHLKTAGFEAEEAIERDPYPDVEFPSRRAYLFARKPGGRP